MKYLLLIYNNPEARRLWQSLPEAERAEGLAAYGALNEELARSGRLIATEALADPALAKVVTVREGRPIASDGPFAEAKEQLAGFYLVDCDSMDQAVAVAGRVPEVASGVGRVEVRPVMTYDVPEM